MLDTLVGVHRSAMIATVHRDRYRKALTPAEFYESDFRDAGLAFRCHLEPLSESLGATTVRTAHLLPARLDHDATPSASIFT